jgi:hypothetical protein
VILRWLVIFSLAAIVYDVLGTYTADDDRSATIVEILTDTGHTYKLRFTRSEMQDSEKVKERIETFLQNKEP